MGSASSLPSGKSATPHWPRIYAAPDVYAAFSVSLPVTRSARPGYDQLLKLEHELAAERAVVK